MKQISSNHLLPLYRGQTNPYTYINNKTTREQIEKVGDIQDYFRVKDLDWPNEVYRTRHSESPIVETENDIDLLVWEEIPKLSKQTEDTFKRHRELTTAKGEGAYVILKSEILNDEGEVTKTERMITKMTTNGTEQDCYEKLEILRNKMSERGRKRVALYPPGGDHNGPVFRKMAECVLGKIKDIECTIYYQTMERKEQKPKQRNTDAVIIRRDPNISYADQLRKIKDGLKNETNMEIRKNIRNIR